MQSTVHDRHNRLILAIRQTIRTAGEKTGGAIAIHPIDLPSPLAEFFNASAAPIPVVYRQEGEKRLFIITGKPEAGDQFDRRPLPAMTVRQ